MCRCLVLLYTTIHNVSTPIAGRRVTRSSGWSRSLRGWSSRRRRWGAARLCSRASDQPLQTAGWGGQTTSWAAATPHPRLPTPRTHNTRNWNQHRSAFTGTWCGHTTSWGAAATSCAAARTGPRAAQRSSARWGALPRVCVVVRVRVCGGDYFSLGSLVDWAILLTPAAPCPAAFSSCLTLFLSAQGMNAAEGGLLAPACRCLTS